MKWQPIAQMIWILLVWPVITLYNSLWRSDITSTRAVVIMLLVVVFLFSEVIILGSAGFW